MTPSTVAPDEKNDNFLVLFCRLNVEELNDWAKVTHFMRGSIGFVFQEPEVTDDSKRVSDNIVWLQLGKKGSGLSDHDNRTVICDDYWIK